MFKKIALLVLMFSFVIGTVHASSINGDYNGNPIVHLRSDGVELSVQDTPAIIYEGNIMIPIYMLEDIGFTVSWDQDTYSVDVNLQKSNSNKMEEHLKSVSKAIQELGAKYFRLVYDSIGSYAEIDYHLTGNDLTTISNISLEVLNTDATELWINNFENGVKVEFVKISRKDIERFKNEEITQSQYVDTWNMKSLVNSKSDSSTYTFEDAVSELGFANSSLITVDARNLAIELLEIRKTKSKSDYSVQDALRDLGIPQGSTPTLATLKQAVKLISLK